MSMEPEGGEDPDVKRDLRHLDCSLTAENLNPDVMFSKKRGIRSCTPALSEDAAGGKVVHERLKRVPPPETP
jgi:hypothetical protein